MLVLDDGVVVLVEGNADAFGARLALGQPQVFAAQLQVLLEEFRPPRQFVEVPRHSNELLLCVGKRKRWVNYEEDVINCVHVESIHPILQQKQATFHQAEQLLLDHAGLVAFNVLFGPQLHQFLPDLLEIVEDRPIFELELSDHFFQLAEEGKLREVHRKLMALKGQIESFGLQLCEVVLEQHAM